MFVRLFVSLVCGFVLGTGGVVLVPDLGRLAGPLLCDGELAPEIGTGRLAFRCVSPDGAVRPVGPDTVVLQLVPICVGLVFAPVSLLIGRAERSGRAVRQQIRADLDRSLATRAEILGLELRGSYKRQILYRAAMLRISFWVQLPGQRPYEARAVWWVDQEALAQIVPGATLPVRINPLSPGRIYPDEPWAEYVWSER